jgi:hypothetical protein
MVVDADALIPRLCLQLLQTYTQTYTQPLLTYMLLKYTRRARSKGEAMVQRLNHQQLPPTFRLLTCTRRAAKTAM